MWALSSVIKVVLCFLTISALLGFTLVSNTPQAFAQGGGGGVVIPPGTTCADCELDFQECEGGMTGYEECEAIRDDCRAQLCRAVGGEMFPVDTTALLLAATYSTASWMIPLMIAAVGFGIIITRQKSKLKHNSCPSCKIETEDFFELGDKVVSKCDNPKCRVNLFFIRRYRNSFN